MKIPTYGLSYREGCTLKFNRMFFSKKNSRSVSYEFLGADMHNHVLPGIDDGAPDVAASLKLLKMLFEIGFKKVIPTPHRASNLYPNDPCTIQKAWDTIASRLKTDPIGYPDILKFGAEYMLDGDFCSLRKTNRLMTFANNRVLIEMSYAAASPILLDEIYELQMAGYKPILAHPERYSYISGNYSYLENLVRRGCELQLNLLSLTDCHGRLAQKTALKLLDMELYHWAGTDVHNEVHINFLKELLQSRYVELLIEYPFQNKLLLQY
jgi:protein-tyrosine phosphatase